MLFDVAAIYVLTNLYLYAPLRECCCMALQELERHFLLELLHITQSALLSEFQAQSWFRSSLVKVLGWLGNCLSWQGRAFTLLLSSSDQCLPFLFLFSLFLNFFFIFLFSVQQRTCSFYYFHGWNWLHWIIEIRRRIWRWEKLLPYM